METGPSAMGNPFLCHYKLKGFKSCETAQTLCEMRSRHRMGCKNGPKGRGGPGALLLGLSLGDNPSTVLLLICSGPEQAPWVLGGAERLLSAQHPGLERGSQSRAESPHQGHPSGHPTGGMLKKRGLQHKANCWLLPHPALERTLVWKGAEIKHNPFFP